MALSIAVKTPAHRVLEDIMRLAHVVPPRGPDDCRPRESASTSNASHNDGRPLLPRASGGWISQYRDDHVNLASRVLIMCLGFATGFRVQRNMRWLR